MSLVAYDYSDSEGEGSGAEEEPPSSTNNPSILERTPPARTDQAEGPQAPAPSTSLNLPQPKISLSGIDWKDVLHSRDKFQPVRIRAPALPDPDDAPSAKKGVRRGTKACGLFSVLPQPKNPFPAAPPPTQGQPRPEVPAPGLTGRQVTTQVVRKKLTPDQVAKLKKSKPPKLAVKPEQEEKEKGTEGENSDDENPDSFFFAEVEVPPESYKEIESFDYVLEPAKPAGPQLPERPGGEDSDEEDLPAPVEPAELDEEGLAQLVGEGAAKRKRLDGEIEFVDIDGDALVGNARLMVTRGLSEETSYVPKRKKTDLSNLSVRKHQITYLAAHAKEMELELKNQWGANRLTKKQTQSKYGF